MSCSCRKERQYWSSFSLKHRWTWTPNPTLANQTPVHHHHWLLYFPLGWKWKSLSHVLLQEAVWSHCRRWKRLFAQQVPGWLDCMYVPQFAIVSSHYSPACTQQGTTLTFIKTSFLFHLLCEKFSNLQKLLQLLLECQSSKSRIFQMSKMSLCLRYFDQNIYFSVKMSYFSFYRCADTLLWKFFALQNCLHIFSHYNKSNQIP